MLPLTLDVVHHDPDDEPGQAKFSLPESAKHSAKTLRIAVHILHGACVSHALL